MAKRLTSGVAGAVRVEPLSLAELHKQEKHGKRTDTTSNARQIRVAAPVTTTGLDLRQLYRQHVEGAFVPKSRTKVLQVLIQFPKELVDENDPEGLLEHARAFGRSVWGEAAIFADRYDRDEKSAGVVDLFVAPKYQKVTKRNPAGRLAVSMTRHNKALAEKHGRNPTKVWDVGKSLQDEFYIYLRDVMRLEGVKRGSPKIFAGSDWKSSEQLRAEELEAEGNRLKEFQEETARRNSALDRREQSIGVEREMLNKQRSDQTARENALKSSERSLREYQVKAVVEATQTALVLRAADDEGLELRITDAGLPVMNEEVMSDDERAAYRSTWSDRVLELARSVASMLQRVRHMVAAALQKEKAATDREIAANALLGEARSREHASKLSSAMIERAKALAESFLVSWQDIPTDERSPPVRDAVGKAQSLLQKNVPPAVAEGDGRHLTGQDALKSLTKGLNKLTPTHPEPGRGKDGVSR